MADLPISGLPAATTPLTGAEIAPLVQGGVTSQATLAEMARTASGAKTTLASTTSGSALWSQPFVGANYKKVIVYLNAYFNSSGVAQTITFPVAFTRTPFFAANAGPCTATTTTLTLPASMAAAVTGWVVLEAD